MTTIANGLKAGAFTLSELLISLVLLAVIATFAVSKISQVVEVNRRKAIFKEDFAAVYEIYRKTVMLEGRPQSDMIFALRDNLAASRVDYAFFNGTGGYGGFTMPNGSTLNVYALSFPGYNFWVIVDFNGASGPNSFGEDALFVEIMKSSGPQGRAHTMVPSVFSTPANVQAYNDLWK